MEYSLSDIQLPDGPKESDSKNELEQSNEEINSPSKVEKPHFQSQGASMQNDSCPKDDLSSFEKEVHNPIPAKTSAPNKKQEEDLDISKLSTTVNVKESGKSLLKEINKHNSSERFPANEDASGGKESKHVGIRDFPTKEISGSLGDAHAVKNSPELQSKKNSPHKSYKSKQHNKSKKNDLSNLVSEEKHPSNAKRNDSSIDIESAKVVRRRKNRRTSRSSSRSSSSESSCGNNNSSSDREHPKKSLKAISSSEGIASPSSSKSSSDHEMEEDKKDLESPKIKTDKVDTVIILKEVVKQRRKINRNLPTKGIQELVTLKELDVEDSKESGAATQKLVQDDSEKSEETMKKNEVREIKFTPRKLSLTSVKSGEKSDVPDCEKSNSKAGVRKRKWGNCAATLSRTSVSISSDSLKTLIPDMKPFTVTPVLSDQDDLSNPRAIDSPSVKEPKLVNLPGTEEAVHEDASAHLQNEKASNGADTKDSPNKSATCVSPPHNPTTKFLFVKNLVRPFTLLQLKELLKQTGNIVEENFWIDKIKSKCIVMYETEDQAVTTRTALHGTRWPLSNPKILFVDFSTEEELDAHKNMTDQPKPVKVVQQASVEKQEIKEVQTVDIPKRKEREESKREKERQKLPVTHVREWDKDKLTQDSPDQTSHRVEKDLERVRSDKRKEKKESKRRVDDDAPAKLLDDLFRKTRASPCIYWLPLTEEQAKQREEERLARRLEREKRWQQRKEQEENERRNRTKGHSGREKENRRSQSRSRSPQGRRR